MLEPSFDARLTPVEARREALARGYSAEAARRAAALAASSPAPDAWVRLLAMAAGGLGGGLLASALVTFCAANWDRIGRLGRLGAVELVLVAATLVTSRWFGRLAGRLSLDIGFVAVGALLAVFGQTYQTGADPYQLFLGWAALGAPWVLIARAEELWLLETVVLGVGLARASQVVGHGDEHAIALIAWAIGVSAIALWELQRRRAQPWLQARWLPRAWASLAGLAIAFGYVVRLFDRHGEGLWREVAGVTVSLGAVAWAYHLRTVELYMQTVALGVAIVVTTATAAYFLVESSKDGVLSFFVVTLLVVIETAGTVTWLRGEARRANGRPLP